MTLLQLTAFIGSKLGRTAYPLEFPYDTEDETCVVVDIISGNFEADVKTINFQIMTKSRHPSTAEAMLETAITTLHNMTDEADSTRHVILIRSLSTNPFYNGQDKNKNYIFTTDFTMLVE